MGMIFRDFRHTYSDVEEEPQGMMKRNDQDLDPPIYTYSQREQICCPWKLFCESFPDPPSLIRHISTRIAQLSMADDRQQTTPKPLASSLLLMARSNAVSLAADTSTRCNFSCRSIRALKWLLRSGATADNELGVQSLGNDECSTIKLLLGRTIDILSLILQTLINLSLIIHKNYSSWIDWLKKMQTATYLGCCRVRCSPGHFSENGR